jgi:NDP-sugar pyrophosphorylase family protein
MKAMVLAAGIGSRLRPLTDRVPKALVDIGGMPLVEIALRRLAAAGVREAVVNTHHEAEQLERFLRGRTDLEPRIEISHETELLDTGGGIKRAATWLAGSEPFIVHNADVVSDVDLRRLVDAHRASGALATLSVRARRASRVFLFDAGDRLRGWQRTDTGELVWANGPVDPVQRLGFDGIQVLSPRIFDVLTEVGAFSMTQAYLRLAGDGERIVAFRADAYYWADVGSLSKLEAVRLHVAAHGLPL